MNQYLIKNATVVTLHPAKLEKVDLRIQNGTIRERGVNLSVNRGEEVVDLSGKIVMPGLVCAHTHLYSSLARGMPTPKEPPKNFLEILQKIWWRLDKALDEETIYYSALVGGIEAVRGGTTVIVDHHSSPKHIKGSLKIIKEALQEIGIRGVLCYEVTDRGGKRERDLGIKENEDFLRSHSDNSFFRGLVGAHASFTLNDDSLKACVELAHSYNSGVHIHLAEDKHDINDAKRKYGLNVVRRLEQAGVFTPKTVLAHGTHLSRVELSIIRDMECWLVHNPRSNMNNSVGYAHVQYFGERSALGTDGFPADMFEEVQFGYFKSRDASNNLSANYFARLLQSGHVLCSEIFGVKMPLKNQGLMKAVPQAGSSRFGTVSCDPSLRDFAGTGNLDAGSVADLIVLDYPAPTPLTEDNLAWHFIFGMRSACVESVIVGGRWIIKNRKFEHLNVGEIYRKAQKAAEKLWRKL